MMGVMAGISSERITGLIVGLSVTGLLLTGWLGLSELFKGPTCPHLLGVPACYLVLVGYLLAVAGAWLFRTRTGDASFFIGVGAVTLIGVYFSWSQLAGHAECPTFEGLPMCYVSLLAGLTMLGLDQVRRRLPVTAQIS
jgi:hypothetical protein